MNPKLTAYLSAAYKIALLLLLAYIGYGLQVIGGGLQKVRSSMPDTMEIENELSGIESAITDLANK